MRTIDNIELDYMKSESLSGEDKLQLLNKIYNDLHRIQQAAARDWSVFTVDVIKRVGNLYSKVTGKINILEAAALRSKA